MAAVTETRDSGIEILDTDVEMAEDANGVHFRLDSERDLVVDSDGLGHDIVVEEVQYFIAASIEAELGEMEKAMMGAEVINESSVFISNEDGELGAGIVTVDEGDIEDAYDEFEAQYL